MPAYNFQSRFVQPIRDRTKRQTCRRIGKRRHARPGEAIQLYTGMRTRNCQKILDDDPFCLTVRSAEFDLRNLSSPKIFIEGIKLNDEQMHEFAIIDGFKEINDFVPGFVSIYGNRVNDMVVINWGWNDASNEIPW